MNTPCIYLFEAVDQNLVKLGFTRNPVRRFLQIQTSCPFEIQAVCLFPGTRELETELHQAFAGGRSHGEWYKIDDEELDNFMEWREEYPDLWREFTQSITRIRKPKTFDDLCITLLHDLIRNGEFDRMKQYDTEGYYV